MGSNQLVKRIYVIIFFISWIIQLSFASDNSASGLLFRSNNELIDHRTSLDLFNGSYKKFENTFSVNFDLSIWDIKRFGYVLRLVDEQEKEISLVFVNFKGNNNLYFDFNYSETTNSVQIPVSKENLVKVKWINFSLTFDLKNDKSEITVLSNKYTCENIGLPQKVKFKFIFGLYGINLDVPEMAIRNIEIKEGDKIRYFFPLKESSGEDVHNNKGKILGKVKNPVWIINRHFNWQKEAEYTVDCTAGITQNDSLKEIIAINKDSVITYNVVSKELKKRKLSQSLFTINSGEAIYSHLQDKCFVYNLNESDTLLPSFAVINMKNYEVEHLGRPVLRNRLHHHNVFFNETEDSLFIFGGYGNFSYSNMIYKYDINNDRWLTVPISGDEVFPRFIAAMGKYPELPEYLIFGGFGNRSGKQEMGGKNLYDLMSLNIDTKKIRKLWVNKNIEELFVPCSNLIINAEKNYFYTLCYPHHLSKTELKLYKFSIEDGSYEVVSNAIPILSEKINTNAYLFFDENLNEFQAVVREYINDNQSALRVYSLLYPPITHEALEEFTDKNSHLYWVIIVISVILLAAVYFILRKRKHNHTNVVKESEAKESTPKSVLRNNAIYVLGDFCAYDLKGNDISYRFSNKLRHIFALILCNSTGHYNGISTEKLSSDLWPEKEISETKNIRGVTINHLRSVLNDMDSIKLVFQNSKWLFVFENDFYCDYTDSISIAQKLLSQTGDLDENINELSKIIKRGQLFPAIQTLWMDQYKHEYEELMEKILKPYLTELYEKADYTNVVKLAEIYFSIDPLNEKALVLSIRSLRKLGKSDQAQSTYNRFNTRYKTSMGQDFYNTYTNIINNI